MLYMRQGPDGSDEVLIDPHPLSADHTTTVSLSGVSHDAKLLAYGVRQGGLDEIEIRVREVGNGPRPAGPPPRWTLPQPRFHPRQSGLLLRPARSE